MLIQLSEIHVSHGKVRALHGISMEVAEGGIVTIIGANGAGKSTTLRTISGLCRPTAGSITFLGQSIETVAVDQIVKLGISHVPEGRRVFPDMTVEENLRTGAYLRYDRMEVSQDLQGIFNRFPVLEKRRKLNASSLSGGEQQMLAIGRALMSRPKLLLLDEPSMGLAPVMVRSIGDIIRTINSTGVAVVLVEQNAELALNLADYAYVLENGRITLEGKSDMLRDNEQVRSAYLGV